MSNSAVALVFLLSGFRFVIMVTETTKLGLEDRHCRVKATTKKTTQKAQINKLQCRAGTYCQTHGDDDTAVQQFKVQFQWSVCPTLRSVQEPGGVEDSRSSRRQLRPAGFVHQALVEPGGRAPGASP